MSDKATRLFVRSQGPAFQNEIDFDRTHDKVEHGSHGWVTREEDLTRQSRNFLLMTPLSRLEANKSVLGPQGDDLFADIDTNFLVLSLFDYISTKRLLGYGAMRDDAIGHLIPLVKEQNHQVTDDNARLMAALVLDYMSNSQQNHKAFSFPYWDAQKKQRLRRQFRLLTYLPAEDGNRYYRLTDEGYAVLVQLAWLNPKVEQEVDAILIKRLIKRGEIENAITIATRNKARSSRYRQEFYDTVSRMKRNIRNISWKKDVDQFKKEALKHLRARIKEEGKITRAISKQASKASAAERKVFFQLESVLGEGNQSHNDLLKKAVKINEQFRFFQSRRFRPRRTENIPDFQDQILEPLAVKTPHDIAPVVSEITALMNSTSLSKIFDPFLLLASSDHLFDQKEAGQYDVDPPVLKPIVEPEPTYTKEFVAPLWEIIDETVFLNGGAWLSEIMIEAKNQNFDLAQRMGIFYLVVGVYFKEIESPVYSVKKGEYGVHPDFEGNNLFIERVDND